MKISRRGFGQFAAGGLASAAFPGRATARIEWNGVRIDTLADGHLVLPQEFVFGGLDPEAVQQLLERHGVAPGPLKPEVNVTLLRDGGRTVLFDAGAGPGFQDTAGRLPAALETAGVAPEEVTHIVFTHCHPDHLWGVLDDFDDLLFPDALPMMGRTEWEYWFNPETADTIGSARAAMAAGARRRMEVLEDRMQLFGDGQEILPGIAAVATPGHTPGHMSFEIRSGSESLLVLGDALANHHAAFAEPAWPSGSDQDPQTAAATRMHVLDRAAADQMLIMGCHLPGGGIGRAERSGSGYRFAAA